MSPLSLSGRALAALARREHSRAELYKKLKPHAESEQQLTTLLDHLEAQQLLSPARFIESLARRRGEKMGVARIQYELQQHQLPPELVEQELMRWRASEYERALAVWRKKFPTAPTDAADRAKQMRFLAGRGFSAEVIRRVVEGRAKI